MCLIIHILAESDNLQRFTKICDTEAETESKKEIEERRSNQLWLNKCRNKILGYV